MDGWGDSAYNIIKSLCTTDVDLTLRHIYLSNCLLRQDQLLDNLESKTHNKYDVIIQNCLPEFFSYYHGSKNIGFLSTETCRLNTTPWIPYLNLMDEIWVHSTIEIKHLQNAGCTTPIYSIGSATDVSQFDIPKQPRLAQDFTFYSIGNGERKNFEALILAFYLEFARNEPVELLIKTSNNLSLSEYISKLGIYKNIEQYKPIHLVNQYLSEEQLINLHQTCDCFIMPSRGEAWCRPALDALGYGNTPIVTANTGMIDFINDKNGWVVTSKEVPIIAQQKPLPYLYTARDTWYEIDVLELCKAMRQAYISNKSKSSIGISTVKELYSYQNIGKELYAKLSK